MDEVADGAVVTHDGRLGDGRMDHRPVLDRRAGADADAALDVAPQHGRRPDARPLADHDPADDHRVGVDERVGVDFRFEVAERVDGHDRAVYEAWFTTDGPDRAGAPMAPGEPSLVAPDLG